MDSACPIFDRRTVNHGEVRCGTLRIRKVYSKVLATRRREFEQGLHDRLRKRKQTRGLLRSHSVFLERKAKSCFFGYHFTDSMKADLPYISGSEAEELSEYLFRCKYIVPVMKFVNEMSPTTVVYRYAQDEKLLKRCLTEERLTSLQLVQHLMDHTSKVCLAGNKILELLDSHVQARSHDTAPNQQFLMPQTKRLAVECQQMLHHGYLIPECYSRNAEQFQKFRPETSYYLCDGPDRRELAALLQDAARRERETRSRNTEILGRCNSQRICNVNKKKTSLTLRRSASLNRSRKMSKANVYWTMDVDMVPTIINKEESKSTTRTNSAEKSDKVIPRGDMKRQLSERIIAPDVEVIDKTEDILTYTPPARKTSLPDKLKRIYKKLTCAKHMANNGTTLSFSSIDAEFSVY